MVIRTLLYYGIFLLSPFLLFGQTIEEKISSQRDANQMDQSDSSCQTLNHRLSQLRKELEEKYQRVDDYYQRGEKEEAFQTLLIEVNELRTQISELEAKWRDLVVDQARSEGEEHSLWDEAEVTLSQLIMEYGSSDYLYSIPPEILTRKIHLHSGIPVPRESWSRLLEIILFHNGVGIKKLNPFARQLYLLKNDLVAVDQVLTDRADLSLVSDHARIAYIFSPPPERAKGVRQFFERFRDRTSAFIYQVGYKIAIIASKEEVHKLLTLHEAIWETENGKVAEILPMTRLAPHEMEKILRAYFGGLQKKPRISRYGAEGDDLVLIPLKEQGSIALIGSKEIVAQAKKIVKKTEAQLEDPMEMTVYWYTCRHSDPIDVCEALEKVYAALVYSGIEGEPPAPRNSPLPPTRSLKPERTSPLTPPEYGPPRYSPVTQPPPIVSPTIEEQKRRSYTTNFIPYPKSGSIMMVVRRDTLNKIKDLLHKIDVPKKMVRIEALFFEKRIDNVNQFGLNLFAWGAGASNTRQTGVNYSPVDGILNFFVKRANKSFWGTFDIAYNFLLSQQDVRIKAAPSTVTLNQMPAKISVQEEISISNGVTPIDNANLSTVVYERSFSRAQYGITLVVTPTVHDPVEGGDPRHSVTLETNINFDTFSSDFNRQDERARPNVMRRQVENSVRVPDGETVILGGLRRKDAEDTSKKLPFLGEIPGIGKLFGSSVMTDRETEMFIFITPRIIFDAGEDLEKARREQLIKRPGDLPEFLVRIEEAKRQYKRRLFDNSLKLIFGNIHD